MYRVLIACYSNWDALSEVPAILKRGGCTVDVFCGRGSWLKTNRFHDRWIESPADKEQYIPALKQHVTLHNYDWIILGDDPLVKAMNDSIVSEQEFYTFLPLTRIENRELLGSKSGFSEICTRYSIRTPQYVVYDGQLDIMKKKLSYPIMVKVDQSAGGHGVFLCRDASELAATIEKIEERRGLVLQQFIKGYDVNVEVLYKNGELIMYNYSRTEKTFGGKFGISTQRICYPNTEIEPELRHIGQSIGIDGFVNMVFIFNEADGKHYLIEVDIRPNSWFYYGKFCGNDFSRAVKSIVAGRLELVKPAKPSMKRNIRITLFKKDMMRCILEKDRQGKRDWLTNKEGRWRYIPFYDLKLLYASVKYLFDLNRKMAAGDLEN